MGTLLNDIVASLRLLLKNKSYTLGILMLFALGIGANTAIFSLTDAVLFRDLPVARPGELARLYSTDDTRQDLRESSYPAYLDYARETSLFTGVAAWSDDVTFHLSRRGEAPQRIDGAVASGNFFQVLGVPAALGRTLLPEDDRAGAAGRAVVLSDGLWRRRFGADPKIIGTDLHLNSASFTVAGVMPPAFQGASFDHAPELWVPLAEAETAAPEMKPLRPLQRRGIRWLMLVARLRPGMRLQEAQARLDASTRARVLTQAKGELDPFVRIVPARFASLDPSRSGAAARLSWILLGAVAFVLLIACADAAGLFLARAERRRQEMAIRVALGASRLRLARLLLTEGVILSLAGGALGSLLAATVIDFATGTTRGAFAIPLAASTPVFGLRVLLFTLLVALATALIFVAGPLLRVSHVDPATSLKGAGGWVRVAGARIPVRSLLVTLQVGLSVALLVGAGLMIRTLANAFSVQPGFNPDGAVTAELDLSRQGYDRESGTRLYHRLLEGLASAPGIRSAALALSVPIRHGGMSGSIELEGYTPAAGESPEADLNIVTPGYLATLGSPLLRGRDFSAQDRREAPLVAIVNRAFAERYWPGQEAVGKKILNLGPAEVIGVVADVRSRSLREGPRPTLFVPIDQFYSSHMTLLARTPLSPEAAGRTLAAVLRGIDESLPLFQVRGLRERLGSALDQERMLAGLFSAFALLAMILSVAGLYSIVACSVQDRTREWGIRMALGARPGDLFRMVERQGFRVAIAGLVLGLPASWLLSRSLGGLLFGVPHDDPLTYVGVAAALLLAALLGCALPALRASSQSPMAALRDE